jgi:hypothetical protein
VYRQACADPINQYRGDDFMGALAQQVLQSLVQ